jgi:hypothetical protein
MFPRSHKKIILKFRAWEVPVLMRSPKVQEGNTLGCGPCLCVFLLFLKICFGGVRFRAFFIKKFKI